MGKFGPFCLVQGVLIVASLAASSCSVSPNAGENTSESEQTLEAYYLNETLQSKSTPVADEAIIGTRVNHNEETTIGDINNDQAILFIPPGAYESDADIIFENNVEPPPMVVQGTEPISKIIQIKLISEKTRSAKPLLVSIAFDSTGIREKGEVLVGYFHQDYGWELFAPAEVDLEQGILNFNSYHLSTFVAVKVDDQVRRQRFIEQQALLDFLAEQNLERACSDVILMIESFIRDGLHVEDEGLIEMIAKGMAPEVASGETRNVLLQSDYQALTSKVMERTARYISLQQTDIGSTIRNASASFPPKHPLRESFRIAARGLRINAQRILEDYAAEHLPPDSEFYIVCSLLAETDRFSRDIWQNQEMHDAYRAYAQGADGRYGYNIAKGDFNGIVRQNQLGFDNVINNYISIYCAINNLDESRLDKPTLERLYSDALAGVLWLFDERLAHAPEIDRKAASIEAEMEQYASRGLLQWSGDENPILQVDADTELETLMQQLISTRNHIIHTLGRSQMVETQVWEAADPDARLQMIPQETLVELVDQWFSRQLNLKQMAYIKIIEALQESLQQGSGWREPEISALVDKMVNKYP